MPKPDQNVSSSAALQRPQRQKALPKPVAKNVEIDTVQSTTQSADNEAMEKLDISEETSSNLPELSLEAGELTSNANFSEPTIIETKPEPKKVISIGVGAVDEKTKPKLKPKPVIDPTVSESEVLVSITSTLDVLEESSIQHTDQDGDRSINQLPDDELSTDFGEDVIGEPENAISTENPESRDTEDVEAYDEVLESDIAESYESNLESAATKVSESAIPIFWCQAVGLVVAKYVPSPEVFHKGELITDSGFIYKAYVLSKAVKSLEKKIDLSLLHHFVVYPKTSKLHGVRFEILATDISSKIEEFKDGEFNIRGLVTKHAEDSVLIEIQRRPEYLHPAQYDRFSLEVKGNIPAEMMQQFICLKCQLSEDRLNLVSYEHLACPITPKLTKTEKPILKPKAQKIEPALESTTLD